MMNLYSAYHARYMAGFLLRDFIASERKALISPSEAKPLSVGSPNIRVVTLKRAGVRGAEDKSKDDLYAMLQAVLKRYTDGNTLLKLAPEDSVYNFPPALIASFQQDSALFLSKRLRGRKEVFCRSEAAGIVATKGAWEDIDAITRTFEQATYDVNPAHEEALDKVRGFVEARKASSQSRAQGLILEKGFDFELIP